MAVIINFYREEVEQCDLRWFYLRYRTAELPVGKELHGLLGTFVFSVDGWDDDPREVYHVPEIRRFFQEHHRMWPNWLYFCSLERDNLKSMLLCCVPVWEVPSTQKGITNVGFDLSELMGIIGQQLLWMNRLFERAGLGEAAINTRTREVFECLGLPTDGG